MIAWDANPRNSTRFDYAHSRRSAARRPIAWSGKRVVIDNNLGLASQALKYRASGTQATGTQATGTQRISPSPNPLTHSRGELSECVAGVALGQFCMDQVRLFAIVPGRLQRIVECRFGFDEVSFAAAIGLQ